VFSSEDRLNVLSILYAFELLRKTLHVWDIHRDQRIHLFAQTNGPLRVNNRVNETLGITVKLQIASLATNFSK
jgi:hypothetical protein